MRAFYRSLFQSAYRWSATHEFDKQPSLFSAVLYVSALQFINLLTVVFFMEAIGLGSFAIAKSAAASIPLCFFIFNWYWASRNSGLICGEGISFSGPQRGRKSVAVVVYVVASLLAFVVGVTAYVLTGP